MAGMRASLRRRPTGPFPSCSRFLTLSSTVFISDQPPNNFYSRLHGGMRKKRAYRFIVVDPLDRLGKQRRDREDFKFLRFLALIQGNAVCDDHFLDDGILDFLNRS